MKEAGRGAAGHKGSTEDVAGSAAGAVSDAGQNDQETSGRPQSRWEGAGQRRAALPLVAFTAGCRRLRVWLLG